MQLHHANCFALDPSSSLRFERIYVGAGASQQSAAIIFRMLAVGGVIVGPFAGADGAQRLLKVRRVSETEFQARDLRPISNRYPIDRHDRHPISADLPPLISERQVRELLSVQFTPLVLPSHVAREGLVSLPAPRWSVGTHHRFPAPHRAAVRALLAAHARADCVLGLLPKDVYAAG